VTAAEGGLGFIPISHCAVYLAEEAMNRSLLQSETLLFGKFQHRMAALNPI
jgi:hypothetical protein